MAPKGSQIIREHDDLNQRVSSLVDRKNRLEDQLEQRRRDIQEKQDAFANIAPRMEAERSNYRSASLKRAEAQKQYDEIQGQCWPLIERRDEARKGDEKRLRPFKRKLDRAQRAYERALERREQAKQRHDSAKSMEGFAAITAVTDTVRSFGGDASTRSMKQFQRSVSQGNFADASNASAARALELDEAEEAVILAQEDLEDAAEEYEEQQNTLVGSRREIEDAGNRAEALVNGFVIQMMNNDRIIACAERAIDSLDELSQQTHLLEEAARDEEELSNSLSETELELASTREQLAAIEDAAAEARRHRGVRRIVLGVLATVAVVAIAACAIVLTPASTDAGSAPADSSSTDEVASPAAGPAAENSSPEEASSSDNLPNATTAVEASDNDIDIDYQAQELNEIYEELAQIDSRISIAAQQFNDSYLIGSLEQRREYATDCLRIVEDITGTWTPLQDKLRSGAFSPQSRLYEAAQALDNLCNDLYQRAHLLYSAWDLDTRYADPIPAKDDILGILESRNNEQGINIYKEHFDKSYPLWAEQYM